MSEQRHDVVALVALVLGLTNTAWATYAHIRSSQVRLYPITEVVLFQDRQGRTDRLAISIETTQANIADGDYADVLELAELQLVDGSETIACFGPRALVDISLVSQKPACAYQLCIDHPRASDVLHVGIKPNAIQQSLPAGEVAALRWMMVPKDTCSDHPSAWAADHLQITAKTTYQDALAVLRGRT